MAGTLAPKPFDAKRWIAGYMRDLEHRIRMENIRKDGEAFRQKLFDHRREDEQITKKYKELLWDLERSKAKREGRTIEIEKSMERLEYIVERDGMVLSSVAEKVERYRADADRWARHYGTKVSETATPGTNAYAWGKLNQIETAPIVSEQTYAVRLHEQGHAAVPCNDTHKRVEISKTESVCVACELAAWDWAMTHAVEWTRDMHRRLSRSLGTYEKHATAGTEAEAVKRMRSDRGYCDARLRRAQRGSAVN